MPAQARSLSGIVLLNVSTRVTACAMCWSDSSNETIYGIILTVCEAVSQYCVIVHTAVSSAADSLIVRVCRRPAASFVLLVAMTCLSDVGNMSLACLHGPFVH